MPRWAIAIGALTPAAPTIHDTLLQMMDPQAPADEWMPRSPVANKRGAPRHRCSLPCVAAVIGAGVQQAGLWCLYSDVARVTSICGVAVVCCAGAVDELLRRRNHLALRRPRQSLVRWAFVLVFALLAWRAVVSSASWCPESSFLPSPGINASAHNQPTPRIMPDTLSARWNAPVVQSVVCKSTVGPLEIELRSDWSPMGVAHFLRLVSLRFFTNVAFFRVVPDFVAQFGISGNQTLQRKWGAITIADDIPPSPAVRFQEGTLSYAGSSANSRATQLFFSLAENSNLGQSPWETPIGYLNEESLESLRRVYKGYGDMPPWGSGPTPSALAAEGNTYLEHNFPNVDYIQSCDVVSAMEASARSKTCGPEVAPWGCLSMTSMCVVAWLLSERAEVEGPVEDAVDPEGIQYDKAASAP